MAEVLYEQKRIDDLGDAEKQLVAASIGARSLAFAPYSRLTVGAAALAYPTFDRKDALQAGPRIFPGGNIENSAYGSTICAERIAIGNAFAGGCPNIVSMAIAAAPVDVEGGDDKTEAAEVGEPVGPCGACEQSLIEMASLRGKGEDMTLLLAAVRGDVVWVVKLSAIRKLPFSAANLGIDLAEWRDRLTTHRPARR